MILYHGSNVTVEQPKLIRQNRYLDFGFGFYYCMERYRHFKGLSGADVAKTFEEYGIYGYITKYFESLHTMGDHCIVQDIDDYISSITGNKRIKA